MSSRGLWWLVIRFFKDWKFAVDPYFWTSYITCWQTKRSCICKTTCKKFEIFHKHYATVVAMVRWRFKMADNREFKLRVIRQTANVRQRKILRYQAIKSKWTCCFKIEIHNYSFDARKKIWKENVQRKFCQEISYQSFAVPGNVKLKKIDWARAKTARVFSGRRIYCVLSLGWFKNVNNMNEAFERQFCSDCLGPQIITKIGFTDQKCCSNTLISSIAT